jgi:PAS domain S-box-containing protein
MEHKPNYKELLAKLAELEEIIRVLRNQEVDAVIGNRDILMLRLRETEDEVRKHHDHLEGLVRDLETQADELRLSRQKAQESRNRYLDLYDYAPVSYLTLEKDGRILEVNLTAARLLGLDKKDLIHSELAKFITPDSRDTFYFHLKQAIETDIHQNCEIRMQKKDGSEFYAVLDSIAVRNLEGNANQSRTTLTDVTERKKAEEALAKAKDELEVRVKERTRELAQANEQLKHYGYKITQVQEEERKHIAYELREDLVQNLAAIKMELQSLTNATNSLPENVHSRIESVMKMIGSAVDNVKVFSHELRPSMLESLGLPAALEVVTKEMIGYGQPEIVVKTNGAKRRLPDEIETSLFRIAQEALTNIRKHSGATQAKVNVGFLKTGIRLTISDNGKGFDTEHTPETKLDNGYGLINMEERAHQIGGEIKIKSVLGRGTIITVTVPLQPD